jgi:3-hydroxyisobutyrate dehydrogenase
MKTIAVIGLGAMGSRMAARLLAAGHRVIVYNRSDAPIAALEKKGATRAPNPRDAAREADVVISMVADDGAARSVWLDEKTGAMSGLRAGAIAIESSTLTPACASEIARAIEAHGAKFLAAPVIGSRLHAEAGKLIYLVGGGAPVLGEVRELMLAMGTAIHHVGSIESAMTMKLAVNVFLGAEVALLGEVLTATKKLGIDTARAIEILSGAPISSPAMQRIAGLMGARTFAANFPVRLMNKDLQYFTDIAKQAGATSPITSAVADVFAAGSKGPFANDDMSGIVRYYE